MFIALVMPALVSHSMPALALYKRLGAQHTVVAFSVGWSNRTAACASCLPLVSRAPLASTDPDTFNVERAAELIGELDAQIAIFSADCPFDVVVYDFFALEAAVVARRRGLPSICFLPCVAEDGLSVDADAVGRLRALAGADVPIARASDAHYIPGSAPSLLFNRLSETPGVYIDPWAPVRTLACAYIAFGTVVPVHLVRQNPSALGALLSALRLVFAELADAGYSNAVLALPDLEQHDAVLECIAAAPLTVDCSFRRVNQRAHLASVGLFVTHGGGSSTEEALAAGVRMWVVPFFGDQHYAARRVVATQPNARAYLIDAPNAVDGTRDMALDPPRRRVDGSTAPTTLAAALGPRDLVYGRNVDRRAAQVYLGVNLGVDDYHWSSGPRLIDHLNDPLLDGRAPLGSAATQAIHAEWTAALAAEMGGLPPRSELGAPAADVQLYRACAFGAGWWRRYGRVHFLIGDLSPANGATLLELVACLANPDWTHVHYWCAATLAPLTRDQAHQRFSAVVAQ